MVVPTPFPLGNVFCFMWVFPEGTYSVAGEGFFSLFPFGNFLTHHETFSPNETFMICILKGRHDLNYMPSSLPTHHYFTLIIGASSLSNHRVDLILVTNSVTCHRSHSQGRPSIHVVTGTVFVLVLVARS